MRAGRLLSILMLLQTRGRVSAAELADHVEVSIRTIYRDVEHLSAAGIPIYAERGRAGGFRLLEGWRTRLTGFTEAEAQALFLAGMPGPADQLGLGEAMAMAELKLTAALPAGWQDDARRVSSRVHLDTVGWYQEASCADHLAVVAAAVWGEEILAIRYDSWNGISERTIRPLGLVIKAGTWYVVAATSGPPHTYRLSNVLAASATGEHFKRPPRFDLARYWEASTRDFEQSVYRDTAIIRASPQGLSALRRLNSALARAADAADASDVDGRGWIRIVIPIESIAHAAEELLKLGTEVEALHPSPLREAMARTADAVAAMYR